MKWCNLEVCFDDCKVATSFRKKVATIRRRGSIFFGDAPGGTGKTFLINLLLAKVRRRNEIALAVASSGIATLLTERRTAHSGFKLPLNLANTETPTYRISRNSGKAKVLKDCKLISWDECTMSHKVAFEAIDVTLKDSKRNNNRMGGVTMVLAGDFRQTLPVIPRGTRADDMQAFLKYRTYRISIQRFGLTTNMRVHLNGDSCAQ
ncbi:hypothetical protein AVEN_7897-1 [Araneus ventricosus]|uniref:ATP-dependent DNA helicase n=1 Tax=Araneus ventricosus TaxID=182803 RepID=A0A4Y2QAE5_ARAVE|nr:hypothetical protein AVEN_7897-1 [Araneus ventricosus]